MGTPVIVKATRGDEKRRFTIRSLDNLQSHVEKVFHLKPTTYKLTLPNGVVLQSEDDLTRAVACLPSSSTALSVAVEDGEPSPPTTLRITAADLHPSKSVPRDVKLAQQRAARAEEEARVRYMRHRLDSLNVAVEPSSTATQCPPPTRKPSPVWDSPAKSPPAHPQPLSLPPRAILVKHCVDEGEGGGDWYPVSRGRRHIPRNTDHGYREEDEDEDEDEEEEDEGGAHQSTIIRISPHPVAEDRESTVIRISRSVTPVGMDEDEGDEDDEDDEEDDDDDEDRDEDGEEGDEEEGEPDRPPPSTIAQLEALVTQLMAENLYLRQQARWSRLGPLRPYRSRSEPPVVRRPPVPQMYSSEFEDDDDAPPASPPLTASQESRTRRAAEEELEHVVPYLQQ